MKEVKASERNIDEWQSGLWGGGQLYVAYTYHQYMSLLPAGLITVIVFLMWNLCLESTTHVYCHLFHYLRRFLPARDV